MEHGWRKFVGGLEVFEKCVFDYPKTSRENTKLIDTYINLENYIAAACLNQKNKALLNFSQAFVLSFLVIVTVFNFVSALGELRVLTYEGCT